MSIQILNTNKFKTVSIVVKFKAPLNIDTMTHRAILSKLIQKTTEKYSTEQQMLNHQALLYGAHLYSNVIKQNNAHVLTIGIDIINDKFLENEDLLCKAFQLLHEVIYKPNLDGTEFKEELILTEKHLLLNKYESIKENLGQYGFYQLLKQMFDDPALQNPSFGDINRLDEVTGSTIFETYQSMITKDEVSLYVVGDVQEERIGSLANQYINLSDNKVKLPPLKLKQPAVDRAIVEHITTKQARINIGIKFEVQHPEKSYFAFILLNQIYGGDPSSLLFTNVREKLSLAYQIHSQIDARSGLLYVLAGVNQNNRIQAIDTITKELVKIKNGDFDNSLLSTAKRMIINHKKESLDRPKGFVEIEFSNTFGRSVSETEWINGIQQVTKEDIILLAQTGKIHTVYCLTSEEAE